MAEFAFYASIMITINTKPKTEFGSFLWTIWYQLIVIKMIGDSLDLLRWISLN